MVTLVVTAVGLYLDCNGVSVLCVVIPILSERKETKAVGEGMEV